MPWKDKSKLKSEKYREYMRNYQREWHKKNKAQVIARAHERKKQMKEFYTQLKENSQCSICGESHPATLQFHHLDPQKKEFILSAAVRQGYSLERIKKEIAKCTILCANCHAKLHCDLAEKNKKPFKEGLAGQFLDIEQTLLIDQEKLATDHMEQHSVERESTDIPSNPDIDL